MLISTSILYLWQKLERRTLSLLTLTSNRICSRFSAYGKDKASFRYGGGKWPLHPGTGLLSPAADPVGRQHLGAQALILLWIPAVASCTAQAQSNPCAPHPLPPLPCSELIPGRGIQAPSPTHPVLPSSLASLAQKIPTASFEELLPLAEDAAEVASQCCDSMAEDCMQKKVGGGWSPAQSSSSRSSGG